MPIALVHRIDYQRAVVRDVKSAARPGRNPRAPETFKPPRFKAQLGGKLMRSILLYCIGIPIPLILLLAMCTHHF
ncbi:MAG TPA: hypothetical protein VII42_11660 [Caulobacteraceae bacterium]|jgi:hypothetical protein